MTYLKWQAAHVAVVAKVREYGLFHRAEGCADFMCVLRGPVSDLALVPLVY